MIGERWYPKRTMVITLPNGARRRLTADQPIPRALVAHVPAKDRSKRADPPERRELA